MQIFKGFWGISPIIVPCLGSEYYDRWKTARLGKVEADWGSWEMMDGNYTPEKNDSMAMDGKSA